MYVEIPLCTSSGAAAADTLKKNYLSSRWPYLLNRSPPFQTSLPPRHRECQPLLPTVQYPIWAKQDSYRKCQSLPYLGKARLLSRMPILMISQYHFEIVSFECMWKFRCASRMRITDIVELQLNRIHLTQKISIWPLALLTRRKIGQ